MNRWRTRAATSRRYSAVERTSSIGASSAASTSAARSAVSGVGGRPSRAASVAVARTASAPRSRARAGRRATAPRRRRPSVAPAERHHDLADRLGPSRSDLAEAELVAGGEPDPDAKQQLVGGERRLPVGSPELARRHDPFASDRAQHERRVRREQDRQGVAGRRGVHDVAADRPAVLDLCGADRRGRLDQHGEMLAAQRRSPDVRVGRQGAHHDLVALDGDAAQGVQAPQVDDPLRRLTELAGEVDHQVRAAGDRPCRRRLGHGGVRLDQVVRARDRRLDGHRSDLRPGRPAA